MDFYEYWNQAEVFVGEGSMTAAEEAWDYQQERIDKLINDLENCANHYTNQKTPFYTDEELAQVAGEEMVADDVLTILKKFKESE